MVHEHELHIEGDGRSIEQRQQGWGSEEPPSDKRALEPSG